MKGNEKAFRWEELGKMLGSKLPALPDEHQLEWLKDTSWVGNYVQQIIDKSMPKLTPIKNRLGTPNTFETHHHVIIRMKISNDAEPLVKIKPDIVKIEGALDHKKKWVRLPCLVIPSTGRASYKNGILQIKIRKKRIPNVYREISVKYL